MQKSTNHFDFEWRQEGVSLCLFVGEELKPTTSIPLAELLSVGKNTGVWMKVFDASPLPTTPIGFALLEVLADRDPHIGFWIKEALNQFKALADNLDGLTEETVTTEEYGLLVAAQEIVNAALNGLQYPVDAAAGLKTKTNN